MTYPTDLPAAELEMRQKIVAEALSWQGTRYHHMGRLKVKRDAAGTVIDKGGTDCAQSLCCIFNSVGLIEEQPLDYYPPDWHLHRDLEIYLNAVARHCVEIPEEQVLPGDIVVFKWGKTYAHGGVIIEPGWPHMVNALRDAGQFLRDRGDVGIHARRPRRFFTFFPK